jgi:DNA-binding CsgD family transcriptional regulator
MSFFDLQRGPALASEAILCTDLPDRVLRRLDRMGNFSIHPLVERARQTLHPFEISLAADLGLLGKNTNDPNQVAPANGLIVPVREDGATVAMAAFVGAKRVLNPLAFDMLKLATQAGWHRSRELSAGKSTTGTPSLTPRELECLTWVARGKTDQDIARILSVAPRTVRFHIDNAKVKLSVASRVQAVTKLLRERPDLAKIS